jgi:hypothetical protein
MRDRGETTEREPEDDRGLPPDRVSIRQGSPHWQPPRVTSKIEVWIDGHRRPNDVGEYCVGEGWLRTISGDLMEGEVRAAWRAELRPTQLHPPAEHIDYEARAEAKRARRAARVAKMSGARSR